MFSYNKFVSLASTLSIYPGCKICFDFGVFKKKLYSF
jgi:hypothetical protein